MLQTHNNEQPTQPVPEQVSKYIDRDLSWLRFNDRVLDQAKNPTRPLFGRLKFLAISVSNLDEFFMVRIGNLYNYIDSAKKYKRHCALQKKSLRSQLLAEAQTFVKKQHNYYLRVLLPSLTAEGYTLIKDPAHLNPLAQKRLMQYFQQVLYPILIPMVSDSHPALPTLENGALVFGIVTWDPAHKKAHQKLSFVQLPPQLPRFYKLDQGSSTCLIPIEEVVRIHLDWLLKNAAIRSATLFRIIRNGAFCEERSDGIQESSVTAVKRKLARRKAGRVVYLEIEDGHDSWMVDVLRNRWDIDQGNIFSIPKPSLVDLSGLKEIVYHTDFNHDRVIKHLTTPPLTYPTKGSSDIFDILRQQDMLLHHPYNHINLIINMLEQAVEDPYVLAIKITLYRIARNSTIVDVLCKAAQKGKHVSVLIELQARFAEEQNIQAAQKLAKAGCLVIHSTSHAKTHAKLFMIVRQEQEQVRRYIHLSSGNYNEETAQFYSDVSLMTTNEIYAQDVAQFFNFMAGHSFSKSYQNLIAAPLNIRDQLEAMIRQEIHNVQQGLPAGIVFKANALEDKATIDTLYQASQAGVPIQLIVRGICCLIPAKPGLSEKITVRAIIGDFLEHARIYYFHNQAHPKIYVGSIDIMTRSFDRRIEALFAIQNPVLKQQVTSILAYNLRDNVNTYFMQADGTYVKEEPGRGPSFDIHRAFYSVTLEEASKAKLFPR
ncbi:MAG: polyphosphate kinase 1 [Bacteroidota bacterium]